MKRLAVLVGDRPGQVDPALLRMLLAHVAMRSEVDIDVVVVVREASLASAWTDAASTADGMLVDADLARRPSLAAVSTPVVVVDLHTVRARAVAAQADDFRQGHRHRPVGSQAKGGKRDLVKSTMNSAITMNR